jgi:hypothetical protein
MVVPCPPTAPLVGEVANRGITSAFHGELGRVLVDAQLALQPGGPFGAVIHAQPCTLDERG